MPTAAGGLINAEFGLRTTKKVKIKYERESSPEKQVIRLYCNINVPYL